jgi:NAD(P)H-dependent flavin oxidoreductase YrpB (nitropropane dioxygenase family)
MLARLAVVTMGAGIPMQIPGVLDAYARGQSAEYRVTVTGSKDGTVTMRFNPSEFFGTTVPELPRPSFIPIVSSDALAAIMIRTMNKRNLPNSIQGFVVEGQTAGGHNAPPREDLGRNVLAEPIYGPRDIPDFAKLRDLGLPFWLAGSYASPAGMTSALSLGANGIQVGSIFALCEESGLAPEYRRQIIRRWYDGQLSVKTDAQASPTGFPFKVVDLPGTLADQAVYRLRDRVCNQHCLSTPHQLPSGDIVYRCPAEPVRIYRRNGGRDEDTVDVRCLCNGLLAAAGLGDSGEPAIVTLGDDYSFLQELTSNPNDSYTAADVMAYLQR